MRLSWVVLAIVVLLSFAAPSAAQSNSIGTGSHILAGRVQDLNGLPVENVRIRLSWLSRGRITNTTANCSGDRIREERTNAQGEFTFRSLTSGNYCMIAIAPGFQNDTAGVELRGADHRNALFVLRDLPPPVLDSIVVAGRSNAQTFRIPDTRYVDSVGMRTMAALSLRRSFLNADVQSITSRDVADAVTLAETDILRSMQRMPGVGTRDDYTATTWTRGAPWDQTRIYIDGIPMYNPTHAGWLFGSVNPDGIGSALYMPGVKPAWIGEGAAGILDLKSRRGGGQKNLSVNAELSVVSARLAVDGNIPFVPEGSFMISTRRTYVDLLTSAMESLGADSAHIPYDFADVIARVDSRLPFGFWMQASGVYERDDLRGDFRGILRGNEADWGNRGGQVTVTRPFSFAEGRVSAGITRFGTRLIELEDDPVEPQRDPTLPSLRNGLRHWSGTVEMRSLEQIGLAARPLWSVGYQYSVQDAEYDGPFSLTAEGIPGVDRDQVIRIPFTYEAELLNHVLWGQALFNVGSTDRLKLDLGLRAEQSERVANGGRLRVSPRASAGFRIDSVTAISLGGARSYQYAQDVGAAAGPLGPQLHLTHIWQLASAGIPAIRTDVTTLGLERQLPNAVLLSMNVYSRRSTGMTIPDPAPGEIRADRPLFQIGTNNAAGIELSAKKQSGFWTGSVSYAYASSRVSAEGYHFPSPADVRHTFDFSLTRRLAESLKISSAFSYSSGVPYTRFVIAENSLRLEGPYARRTPAYASGDISIDYVRPWGSRTFSAYLQLRNVFNRLNPVTYSGSPETCVGGSVDQQGVCSGSLEVHDRFDSGIPVLPLIGLRVLF